MGGIDKPLLAIAAIAAALGFGVVGCGGSPSTESPSAKADEAKVRDLAVQLKNYTKKRDAKGLCSMFEPARLGAWVGNDCVKIFKTGLARVPTAAQLKIGKIKVDGDKASIRFGYGDVDFARIDGEWYLVTPDVKPAEGSQDPSR